MEKRKNLLPDAAEKGKLRPKVAVADELSHNVAHNNPNKLDKKQGTYLDILLLSIEAVPVNRYALAVLALAMVVAMVLGVLKNAKVAIFGVTATIVFMGLIILLGWLKSSAREIQSRLLILNIFLWIVIAAFLSVVFLMISTFAVGWPRHAAQIIYGSNIAIPQFTSEQNGDISHNAKFAYANSEIRGFADFYGKESIAIKTNRMTTKSARVNTQDPPVSVRLTVPTNATIIGRSARWLCSNTNIQNLVDISQEGESIIATGKLKGDNSTGSSYWGEILFSVQYTVPMSIRSEKTGVPLEARLEADKVTFAAPKDYGPLKSAHIKLIDFKSLQVIDELNLNREISTVQPAIMVSRKNIFEVRMSEASIELKLL